MQCSTHNGFVNVDIPISNFQVEAAIGFSTYPGFVLNSRPLATKIGQGHQVSSLAPLTFGEIVLFHEVLLPAGIKFPTVYTKQETLRIKSSKM